MCSVELEECAEIVRELDYEDEIMQLDAQIRELEQDLEQIMLDCGVSEKDAVLIRDGLALQERAHRFFEENPLALCTRG